MSTDKTAQLLFTIATIVSIPTVIIDLFLITWICYHHIDTKLKSTGIWSGAAITCLASCCACIGWYCWYIQAGNRPVELICVSVIFIGWQAGTVSIYVLFIKRLQNTFNATKYDIPRKVYIALFCGCVCFFTCQVITLISWHCYMFDILSPNTYYIIAAILFTTEQIFDFILSVSLLVIFINKLRLLNIDIGLNQLYLSSSDLELNDMNSVQNSSLSKQQLIIIKSLSKITILSCIAIVSTQCFLIFEGVLFWVNHPVRLNAIRYIAMAVDCMTNSVCVVLNFDFANTWYYSFCRQCDYCVTQCCRYHHTRKQKDLTEKLLSKKYVEN